MKKYLMIYKPFLLFLGKFLLTYLLLTFLYQWYLGQFDFAAFETDTFTIFVARQTETLLQFFHAEAWVMPNLTEAGMKLIYNQKYIARIVEGCNALSVIILFISFIVAFTGKLKHTIGFIFFGSVLIHFLNISRIAILGYLLFHFPAYEHVLHGVIFPLFIYGVVFILWIIWVNKFSLYAETTTEK